MTFNYYLLSRTNAVILDASAGVEAQTLTVWQQANNYDIPKLVYLNKMDKPRADPTYCLQELADLTENPLPIQIAASDIDGRFHGLIDLITMQLKVWDTRQDSSGAIMNSCPLLPTDGHMYDKAKKAREELIGVLSDRDSKFGELILETDTLQDLPTPEIVNAIRRCTIRNQVVPVTIGSSYKNVGVQSLMDTIVRLFPSPLEKNNQLLTRYRDTKLCAFAFKVSFHPNYGPLTFVRIYSGKLIGNSRIYNSARSVAEKVAKIFIPFADTLKEVTHAMPGSIVAISGLNQTYTGDCLMQSREFSQQILHELSTCNSLSVCERLIVHGLKPPKPVYFCSIEAPTVSKQKDLEIALQRLQKEDPSFSVTCNDDTKQMVLNGMGELHLEVI